MKLSLKKRIVINLGHGIFLKKGNAIANQSVKNRVLRVDYRRMEPKYYRAIIASSRVDSYAMAAMFYPIKYENVWLTGLPRNDFLSMELENLPAFLRAQVQWLRQIKNGRKLIVYAPTYRQVAAVKEAAYYQFSRDEIDELKKLLKKHNVVMGFRMHYFRNSEYLINLEKYIDNEYISMDFRSASTVKAGLEYRFTPQFSGRLGYAWMQNPYERTFRESGDAYIPNSNTVYRMEGDANYLTGGIGYRFNRNFFLDFAVVYKTQTDDLYPFPNLWTENREELVIDASPFTLKNSSIRGLITLGYKF